MSLSKATNFPGGIDALVEQAPSAGTFRWNDLPDEIELNIIRLSLDRHHLQINVVSVPQRSAEELKRGLLSFYNYFYRAGLFVDLFLVSKRTGEMAKEMLKKYVHLTLDMRLVMWHLPLTYLFEGSSWCQKLGSIIPGIRDLHLDRFDLDLDLDMLNFKRSLINLERVKVDQPCVLFLDMSTTGSRHYLTIAADELFDVIKDDNALLKTEISFNIAGSRTNNVSPPWPGRGFVPRDLGQIALYVTACVLLEFSWEDRERYRISTQEIVGKPTKSSVYLID